MPVKTDKLIAERQWRILSDPAAVAPLRRELERFCADAGFDECTVGEIGLCVNEALANVIRHAYHDRHDQPIQVVAKYDANRRELTVAIRDWGSGVNPDKLKLPPDDPLKPGGLGLVCLRRLMRPLVFTQQPDGMLLTMTRRRS
jgi:anti-sigma regulatory factor (Ser/Thr protein kinase)